MKIAMHEITTRDGSFEQHLEIYAKTGWKHFEINLWKAGEFLTTHGAAKAAKKIRDLGLTCIAATGHGLSAFKGQAGRDGDCAKLKQIGEWMQELGCVPLVVGSDAPEKYNKKEHDVALTQLAEHLTVCAEAVRSYGVTLALEVNWAAPVRSLRSAHKVLERTKAKNVGLVWDPAHFYSTPSRLEDLSLFAGKIVHGHLDDIRDVPIEGMDINADRVIPGQGVLPLREWSERVAVQGYRGWHAVELFNEALWAKDLETICKDVRAGCLAVWPEVEF